MRICLLTNQDIDEDPFPKEDWPCDPRPYLPDADWHLEVLQDKESGPLRTRELIEEGFDLFFNLCDGAEGQDDEPGVEVVQMLEKHGVPFTGASSEFYEPTRIEMKEACARAGLASPDYVLARNRRDLKRALRDLEFPLFVKHHNSYASIDLSRHSRAQSPAGLERQFNKIVSRHGAALIEEYIEGTECTVLVAENPKNPKRPIAYTPVEYRFPAGESFKHEKLKWEDFNGLDAFPVRDPELAERLQAEAIRLFLELKGASFGRVDVRVAADGTPYMLEMNSNCGLYYPEDAPGSADLCLRFDPAGHEGFTRQLVAVALQRARRAARASSKGTAKRSAKRATKAR